MEHVLAVKTVGTVRSSFDVRTISTGNAHDRPPQDGLLGIRPVEHSRRPDAGTEWTVRPNQWCRSPRRPASALRCASARVPRWNTRNVGLLGRRVTAVVTVSKRVPAGRCPTTSLQARFVQFEFPRNSAANDGQHESAQILRAMQDAIVGDDEVFGRTLRDTSSRIWVPVVARKVARGHFESNAMTG